MGIIARVKTLRFADGLKPFVIKVLAFARVLNLWKAAWDSLIWKAMIPKAKAIEGELNWNPN